MKKLLVILSLMVFVGVYAAPALTMSKDQAAKIVAVDKDKKDKKATKAEAKTATKGGATASCCEAGKGEMKAGCCSSATCKEAASCKGEGMKAEEYERVTPMFYRFPEGTVNARVFLLQSWEDANQRLIAATNGWTESELDTLQMPHPAIGMVTLREMLFFTIYHNTLHWHDIQHAGGL